MVSSPSTPAAPDPTTTANAQTSSNQSTALYQAGLNDINQNTPLGSINYNINPTGNGGGYNYDAYNQAMAAYNAQLANQGSAGTSARTPKPRDIAGETTARGRSAANAALYGNGSTGNSSLTAPKLSDYSTGGSIPSTTSTITLNPEVQKALDEQLKTTAGVGALANSYLSNAQNQLSKPYDIAGNVGNAPTPNADYAAKINANQMALEQPYIDRSNEQLDASLANQGITQGSDAYRNAHLDQTNALNNLQQQNIANATAQEQAQYGMDLQGYQQNLNNYNTQYNQPLNEVSALQSGSQVSQPSFSTPSATSVSPTNVAGIYNQAYQNQLGASNASTASSNQLMGGLFGLGGSLGGAAILASDRRLKKSIVRIGSTDKGIPVYRYKYKSGGDWQMGVMADELEKIMPHAVVTGSDGFKAVRYGDLV